jgi:hypothetical protein
LNSVERKKEILKIKTKEKYMNSSVYNKLLYKK